MKRIKIILIANFSDLFGQNGDNALKQIIKYPQEVVLSELAGINFRLRGPVSRHVDASVDLQQEILFGWLGHDSYLINLFKRLNEFSKKSNGKQPILFNRAGCLIGIDFCLRNLKVSNQKFNYSKKFWMDLIEFCLACNEMVTQYSELSKETKISRLEHVNAQQAILNELRVVSNPILTFNRCIDLLKYFENDNFYGAEFQNYLSSVGLNSKSFIESLIHIYFNKEQTNSNIPFVIWLNIEKSPEVYKLLTWLSSHKILTKKHDLDLLTLYKWPVYKFEQDKFFIIDSELLLDKMYRQLINDFYFDHLKAKGITFQNYRSFIGQFFEDYVAKNFGELLTGNMRVVFKHTKKLIFGNPDRELCDLYMRHKQNVMIAQVKSTNLSDEQKFNGSFAFYNGDMDRFYKDVGVTQVIQSIEWMNTQDLKTIDAPFHKKTKVYPVVVLNDKFFETPFMSQVMNNEFRQRLSTINNRFEVKDLTIMSIGSIERLHSKSINNGRKMWKLFWSAVRYDGILPHFNNTLDRFNIHFNPKRELKKLSKYLDLKRK